jgi:Fic family protein
VVTRRPPFTVTPAIVAQVAAISRLLGRFDGLQRPAPEPKLRRRILVSTVAATLGIEGEVVTADQVTALLDGKRVRGRGHEIVAAQNAIAVYRGAGSLRAGSVTDFRTAHGILMKGLVADAGRYRGGSVGILAGSRVAHIAPTAKRVHGLVADLLRFVARDRDTPALVKSAVVHYEIEFIHPFSDGNGRMGRLWQHVVLLDHDSAFAHVLPESIVRERQSDYYAALAESDRTGSSSPFVEYSLETLHDALDEFLRQVRPQRATAADRLQRARAHFGRREFSRIEYMALLPTIAPATASRDLAAAVRSGMATRSGDKATARYRFVAAPPRR